MPRAPITYVCKQYYILLLYCTHDVGRSSGIKDTTHTYTIPVSADRVIRRSYTTTTHDFHNSRARPGYRVVGPRRCELGGPVP